MKLFSAAPLVALVIVTICYCAKRDPEIPLHSLAEAYALMDAGDNAKAIVVLEMLLVKEPGNTQAKILLSSALLGAAGVDVFKAHDHFSDIIFNQSLGARLWGEPEGGAEPTEEKGGTPIEGLVNRIDLLLGRLRQVVLFMNRFPHVDKINWPLLDRALEKLEIPSDQIDKDVRMYRLLINILYFRAYLSESLLKDATLGSKKWICRVDIEHFRESILWTARKLLSVSDDFAEVYPQNAFHVTALHATTAAVVEDIMVRAPAGSRTALYLFQSKFREFMRCPSEE